ncbi:Uncharacterised protein [Klebsiella pneumoniae]|nr:Uncharacterised protein [Klebsiella pneumoniae]
MNIKRIGLDLAKMSSRYMPWITVSMLSFVKPCAVTAWRPFSPNSHRALSVLKPVALPTTGPGS